MADPQHITMNTQLNDVDLQDEIRVSMLCATYISMMLYKWKLIELMVNILWPRHEFFNPD